MNKDVMGVQEVSPRYEFVAENPAVPVGYKQTEVGVIPEDWETKTLGSSLRKGRLGGNYPNQGTASDYPLMKMGNLGRGYFDVSKQEYISVGVIPDKQHRLRYGDVIFNTRNTLDLVGKVAIWRDELPIAYYNSNLMRLEFDKDVVASNEYASYALNTTGSITRLRALATGTTSVAAIYTRDLLDFTIIVPPKSEQNAIATALSDVDALLEELDRLIAKKRDIKQATMQQLLTGETRLPGFEGEWSKMRMGNFGHTYGGLVGKSKGDFGVGTALYVPFTSVMESTVINCQKLEKVSVAVSESQNQVIAGDILFNGSSETPEEVAMCALMEEEVTGLYLNSFCFGFRLKETAEVDPQFLVYFMRSSIGREVVKSLAQGSTRYNLSKTALLNAELNLPKLQEQEAIAAVLSDMDTEIQTLEQRRSKTAELKQGMMQELLTGRTRLV